MRRTCANCHAADAWPRFRYCDDCWRMVGKAVISSAAAVIGARLVDWMVRLFSH